LQQLHGSGLLWVDYRETLQSGNLTKYRISGDEMIHQLRKDVSTGKLEVFSIGESEFTTAEVLVERYAFDSRLRALDALQLAVALELRNRSWWMISSPLTRYFVRLLEGFSVINPEHS